MRCHPVQHCSAANWRDNCPPGSHGRGRVLNIFIALLAVLLVAACSNHPAPTSSLGQPPSDWIDHHTVSKGETLYSIAWRYGKDFRQLAAINGIAAPYSIFPGQKLRLEGQLVAAVQPSPPVKSYSAPVAKAKPVAKAPTKSTRSLTPKKLPSRPKTKVTGAIQWRWPVKGKMISGFRSGDPLRKGVDIAGEKGDSVLAAANGTVIYAGSALRGYGKLLIVKHSEEYLSAYAHNDKLLVAEGSKVKAGQRIAELGSSGTDRNKLHFEIRRNGQPVDPLAYLP